MLPEFTLVFDAAKHQQIGTPIARFNIMGVPLTAPNVTLANRPPERRSIERWSSPWTEATALAILSRASPLADISVSAHPSDARRQFVQQR